MRHLTLFALLLALATLAPSCKNSDDLVAPAVMDDNGGHGNEPGDDHGDDD
jgi:hypothetical protein